VAESTPQNPPRLSVIMPVYNAERYLDAALDSILFQSFRDLELIAVDDGSTDESLYKLRLRARRDERLRVISRPNTGIVGALNDGLAEARGELIGRMDADDTCNATRFTKQVAYLDAHPDCVAVGSWVTRTDPFGSAAGIETPPTDHATIDAALMRGEGSVMVHATMLMRRAALVAAGGWDDRYNWVEDLDLCLRMAEQGELANIPEPLYRYRRHEQSVCFQHYETMCGRLKDVLAEAYRRRGRDDAPAIEEIRSELPEQRDTAAVYRGWACHAIHQRNPRLARYHAGRAVRLAPLKLESWRVLAWALTATKRGSSRTSETTRKAA